MTTLRDMSGLIMCLILISAMFICVVYLFVMHGVCCFLVMGRMKGTYKHSKPRAIV